jgi:hypothetical protein
MFCSIEDAWGEKSFTDKQIFKQSDMPEHFENKQEKEQLYSKYMELKEMFGNDSYDTVEHFGHDQTQTKHQKHSLSSQVCAAVDAHMAKCAHCRRKYARGGSNIQYPRHGYHPYSFDFSNLTMGIRSNKDIVTIFLFGLLVILLLQLFSK